MSQISYATQKLVLVIFIFNNVQYNLIKQKNYEKSQNGVINIRVIDSKCL